MSLPRASAEHNTPRILSVCAGQVCIGHLLTRDRGKSFEAYDQSDRLIGSFNSQSAAACEIFRLIEREFPDITAIEAAQKLVEALADLIKIGAKPEDYEGALRDVTTDLEHVLLQKITFGPAAPPELA
jgi:hypothetical protein